MKPRLREDAPPDTAPTWFEGSQPTDTQVIKKRYRCGSCGAEPGEDCEFTKESITVFSAHVHTELEVAWMREYDIHNSRGSKWHKLGELEKAMLRAVEE